MTLKLSRPKTAEELSGKLRVQTLYNTYTTDETGTVPVGIGNGRPAAQ